MDGPVDYFFAGAASLAEQLDKPVLAVLRDGKYIVGTLISYDHFGSLVLQNAAERHFGGGLFCDVEVGGIYLVRGENLALLGEIDTMRDAANPLLKRASFEEVRQAQAAQEDKEKAAKAAAEAKGLGSLFSTQKASWQMGDATS